MLGGIGFDLDIVVTQAGIQLPGVEVGGFKPEHRGCAGLGWRHKRFFAYGFEVPFGILRAKRTTPGTQGYMP